MPSPGPRDGRHRVVVVGGGFGGLQAALELRGAPVEVTALDRRNFCLFQPLTYQVATGALSAGEVAYWDKGTSPRSGAHRRLVEPPGARLPPSTWR